MEARGSLKALLPKAGGAFLFSVEMGLIKLMFPSILNDSDNIYLGTEDGLPGGDHL